MNCLTNGKLVGFFMYRTGCFLGSLYSYFRSIYFLSPNNDCTSSGSFSKNGHVVCLSCRGKLKADCCNSCAVSLFSQLIIMVLSKSSLAISKSKGVKLDLKSPTKNSKN